MLLLLCNLGLATCLAIAARWIAPRLAPRARAWAGGLSFLCCFPAVLYSLYYLHLFDQWCWFYAFRAHPAANLYPGMLGWLVGWIIGMDASPRVQAYGAMAGVLCILTPFLKPAFFPAEGARFRDVWREGICFQTSPSSCGPASLASLLVGRFGDRVTERGIAEACHTSQSGTEIWYLAQFLRKRGYRVAFCTRQEAPLAPAIAGTRGDGFGHFVAVLDGEAGVFRIADPMFGIRSSRDLGPLSFTGFYMRVERADGRP